MLLSACFFDLDKHHSKTEDRWVGIGISKRGRLLVVIFKDEKYPRASKYFNDLRGSMTNKDLEYIMTQYANPIVAKKEINNE